MASTPRSETDRVAREADRLVSALRESGWSGTRDDADSSGGTGPERASRAPGATPCAAPGVCGHCPVCRGSLLLADLAPERLDQLAELATHAATVIADLAEAVRASRARSESAAGPGPGSPSRRTDIPVTDEQDRP